ncbi:MAG: hypothetical protein ACXABY_11035 [Candidatus Thorarchaeota archaeon]|jgi:hypothetical protein
MTMMVGKKNIPNIGDEVVGLERCRSIVTITFDSGKKVIIHVSEFFNEETKCSGVEEPEKLLVKKGEGTSRFPQSKLD